MKKYTLYKLSGVNLLVYRLRKLYIYQITLGLVAGIILAQLVDPIVVIAGLSLLCLLYLKMPVLLVSSVIGIIYFNINLVDNQAPITTHTSSLIITSAPSIHEYNQSAFGNSVDGTTNYYLMCDKYPELEVGDVLDVNGTFEEVLDMEQSGFTKYLLSKGTDIFVGSCAFRLIENSFDIYSISSSFRTGFVDKINARLPEPISSLLAGILLGDRANLPEALREQLQITGLTHIVAVSGYNIGFVFIWLFSFAGLVNRRKIFIFSVVMIWFFCLLVGLDNMPALRAGITTTLSLLGLYFGRRVGFWLGIIYFVTLIVLINPYSWLDISIQLSIAAVVGLQVFSKPVARLITTLPKLISESLAASISVSITTYPLLLMSFGSTSVIGIVTNLFAVPFIPAIMLLGVADILLDILAPSLADVSWFTTFWVTKAFLFLIEIGSYIGKNITISAWWLWLTLVLILILSDWFKFKSTKYYDN